ncbi:hypothetical protein [Deinococcus sp.]|uniref:hypothetical protein n=1 Tax=Deinococcus sp. TaxID=47478 RepID=UPI003B5C9D7A
MFRPPPLAFGLRFRLLALGGALTLLPVQAQDLEIQPEPKASISDSTLTAYGPIGKWLIAPDGQPANWQGDEVAERALREPINVVLIDHLSHTPQEAQTRLDEAMKAAGYPARSGHGPDDISGYSGLIGDEFYPQQPADPDEAFSDSAWWRANNHGRFFGPAPLSGGGYLWIGAFGREDFEVISAMHHPYNSFAVAREDISARLDEEGTFKSAGAVFLDNTLNTSSLTTDDHDGTAALLITGKER